MVISNELWDDLTAAGRDPAALQTDQHRTLSRCVQRIAERSDGELGEEQFAFVEGCPAQWAELPQPGALLIVGIDGGYVHAREGVNRKAGSFEVIVGKSFTSE